MKKIMFNDRYGLTQAVLDGRKTMTRRIIPQKVVEYALTTYREEYYSAAQENEERMNGLKEPAGAVPMHTDSVAPQVPAPLTNFPQPQP